LNFQMVGRLWRRKLGEARISALTATLMSSLAGLP
jgi:hypothetical protein